MRVCLCVFVLEHRYASSIVEGCRINSRASCSTLVQVFGTSLSLLHCLFLFFCSRNFPSQPFLWFLSPSLKSPVPPPGRVDGEAACQGDPLTRSSAPSEWSSIPQGTLVAAALLLRGESSVLYTRFLSFFLLLCPSLDLIRKGD